MLPYLVTFTTCGFTNDNSIVGHEFSEYEAEGFTEISQKEKTFPTNVTAVVRGHIAKDDGQGDTDIHLFVNVTLRVYTASEDAAHNFPSPLDLLTRIADLMGTNADNECVLSLDGPWQVDEVEVAVPTDDDRAFMDAMDSDQEKAA